MSVLDVRTAIEHRGRHLACDHTCIPLDQLDVDAWMAAHPGYADRPLYILCASGKRALKAAQLFADRGVNAVVVEGGLNACLAENLPVRTKATMSLERQVRIAAGALVLAGSILGFTVSPGFYLLSAAVGTGLVFAGITDFCGLGLLLARAPWNRDRAGEAARNSLHKFEQHQGA